ncbi:cyclin-dependent kinase-like 4 [Temnothorax curvispinosus]|uniref:cyclin-dependent kinase n=1 Tax=Temnothorax curvispinosus TaxID=300111 RepID=A0A6J1QU50_9HYME|nr:cyclin-dependent kinase-like 4 [Temnothorax curvispinosus]XP_024884453.1 cyclin-dependent kinase-like 4 [Temnothorax curvispinosus]XP_024884454.1 cyclin-dependent kinase-like 4 [Temnothorax curvispinosus]
MEKYENIEIVGEGSYGLVMKCRHRETGQIVAIKKFLETEEDVQVRKMAFREIRMLKKLRHENLVSMIEVFRRRKRLYLVFEYLDHTVLDELEESENGLDKEKSRRYIFQILRGLDFCHNHKIMHRDVKPENVLVSPNGVIKLCDFGFARYVTGPNESCTDYVATRWYRAPELLVGDSRYGREIDVWAAGCIYAEMVTGQPLFPGDSDVDQLYRITKMLGPFHSKQSANGSGKHLLLRHAKADEVAGLTRSPAALRSLFPTWSPMAIDFLTQCLRIDPAARPKCLALLQHPFFSQDGFADRFLGELQRLVAKESAMNLLGTRRTETSSRICRSSIGRWQMTLIKERRAANNMELEATESESSPGDRVNANPASKLQINRPRELRYFGPVSVIPNTTYIRRLEHKGLLIPESKGCVLPALTSKTNAKRKKLELPGVKNR